MEFFENLVIMKRLLRQGWVRAGVPQGSIESLADHSWAVTALTYIFIQLENDLRDSKMLDMEKALLIALFHDFPESEYFDIDKSINNIIDKNKLSKLLQELEEGAIQQLVKKTPINLRDSFRKILTDHKSEEYHIARIADLFDIINQTRDYEKKKWLDGAQSEAFQVQAIQQLKQYENQFAFIKLFLAEFED
ncbi:MAG: YfbR-like 5'-deoxynucleotidase [Candidatus Hodarchaeota archaeon]